jgi:hypothetical protein
MRGAPPRLQQRQAQGLQPHCWLLTCCGAALEQHIESQQPLLDQLPAPGQRAKASSNADAAQQLKPAGWWEV